MHIKNVDILYMVSILYKGIYPFSGYGSGKITI